MLLDDACHSIDSINMGAILENVKFPNSRFCLRRQIPLLEQRVEPKRGSP
jgi:hypothetical protein